MTDDLSTLSDRSLTLQTQVSEIESKVDQVLSMKKSVDPQVNDRVTLLISELNAIQAKVNELVANRALILPPPEVISQIATLTANIDSINAKVDQAVAKCSATPAAPTVGGRRKVTIRKRKAKGKTARK